MKNKKFLKTFLASTVVATTVTPGMAFANNQFDDIGDSYAKDNINYLANKNIIAGMGDNKFMPFEAMNRESFAALLGKTMGLEEKTGVSQFTDVSEWAQGMVGALADAGLASGYDANTFGAKDLVTREQMAVFFVRALGYESEALELNLEPQFADSDEIADWAKPLVAFANEVGFVGGYADGTFGPSKSAMRQDVATLSYRLIDPENTDPEVAETVGPNQYKIKAEELYSVNTVELTAVVADIDDTNASNYIVGGQAKPNEIVQIDINYDGGFKTRTTESDTDGNYSKEFDLSGIPDGNVTVTVKYWGETGANIEKVEKTVTKYATTETGFESVEAVNDVTIKVGETFNLPSTVTVNYTDGTSGDVEVTWDTSSVDTATAGTYTVIGTLEGIGETVTVDIIVQEDVSTITIESFNAISDVIVPFEGTYLLPTTVNANYSDGTTGDVNVIWDDSNVDTSTAGTYVVTGTVENTNKTVSVNVIVEELALDVLSVNTKTSTKIEVQLNRVLKSGETVDVKFDGVSINAQDIGINGDVVTAIVPQMADDSSHNVVVSTGNAVEIYNQAIVFDINVVSELVTKPLAYAAQVGKSVTVEYDVLDEDGSPVKGANIRIQIRHYESGHEVIEEAIVASDENGKVTHTYSTLDARRDYIDAISIDFPATVRNEGNITIDWSYAQPGLVSVDQPQDITLGEGTKRTYVASFVDTDGNPLPKDTEVYVDLGEGTSLTTFVGGDFTFASGNRYAKATINNFEGKATLKITDVDGNTLKPMFYYDFDGAKTVNFSPDPEDPRVQGGSVSFVEQVPTLSITEEKTGKVVVGDERVMKLTAIDQFGNDYLGIVKVGLKEAMDNLNGTKYGAIKFDIDVNRDGDTIDSGISEVQGRTGKDENLSVGSDTPFSINFGARIDAKDIERSMVDIIVNGGLHSEKATVVGFVDEKTDGYDSADAQAELGVEFEDKIVNEITLDVLGKTTIAEGNFTDILISFKDQYGETVELSDAVAKDGVNKQLAFQVIDEAGEVIADFDATANAISFEGDYSTYKDDTWDFAEGIDNNDTLSYDIVPDYNPGDNKTEYIVRFTSDMPGNYKVRAFLDEIVGSPTPASDQKLQADEISIEQTIVVEGSVIDGGSFYTFNRHSLDTTTETYTYTLTDQDNQVYEAKEDVPVDITIKNNGTKAVSILDEEARTVVVNAGDSLTINRQIELGRSSYSLDVTPEEIGLIELDITAQVQNMAQTSSTAYAKWVGVDKDMRTSNISATNDVIYTGKVIAQRKTTLTEGWYVLETAVGNVLLDYITGTGTPNKFIVDSNTDDEGLAFYNQISVGDEVAWEYKYDSATPANSIETNKLTNK